MKDNNRIIIEDADAFNRRMESFMSHLQREIHKRAVEETKTSPASLGASPTDKVFEELIGQQLRGQLK
jgi:hypothetical protein